MPTNPKIGIKYINICNVNINNSDFSGRIKLFPHIIRVLPNPIGD